MKQYWRKFAAFMLAILFVLPAAACGKSADGKYEMTYNYGEYLALPEVTADAAADDGKVVQMNGIIGNLCGALTVNEMGVVLDTDVSKDAYHVSLEIKGNAYTLTKQIVCPAPAPIEEGGPDSKVELVFSGKTEKAGDNVKLMAPEKVVANFLVAPVGAQYSRFGENFENVTVTMADIDEFTFPGKFLYYFNTLYFVESAACTDMVVALNAENSTFSIVG